MGLHHLSLENIVHHRGLLLLLLIIIITIINMIVIVIVMTIDQPFQQQVEVLRGVVVPPLPADRHTLDRCTGKPRPSISIIQ